MHIDFNGHDLTNESGNGGANVVPHVKESQSDLYAAQNPVIAGACSLGCWPDAENCSRFPSDIVGLRSASQHHAIH